MNQHLTLLTRLLSSLALIAGLSYGQTVYQFSDGKSQYRLRLSTGEVSLRATPGTSSEALVRGMKKLLPEAIVDAPQGDRVLVHLTPPASTSEAHGQRLQRLSRLGLPGNIGPVLYDLSEEGSTANLSPAARAHRESVARRYVTDQVLVKLDDHDSAVAKIRSAVPPVAEEPAVAKGFYLFRYSTPWEALQAAVWMYDTAHLDAIPLLARQMFPRQASTPNYGGPLQRQVNDPLFPQQWHLSASSPVHLNMNASWDFVTGTGANVTVVDDGLEVGHPDLSGNAYPLSTNYSINLNGGPNAANDPTPNVRTSSHGTACGGIIAATAFNSLGVAGVAPDAKLMGIRLIAGPNSDNDEATAFGWQPAGIQTHVSSNSWGPADDGATVGQPGPLALAAIQQAATQNRGGLGTVIAIAGGNGRASGDIGSYDAYTSNRFSISVCAVENSGQQSSYSENGIALAVCGLGGEFEAPNAIVTTNTSSAVPAGDTAKSARPHTGESNSDYTVSFNGTSAATPMVSGAAALLLSRYPSLSARDVKEIFLRSANRAVLNGGDPFQTNSGGFTFSHSFGAGLLNVSGALTLADTWTKLPAQTSSAIQTQTPGAAIADNDPNGVTATFNVPEKLRVEAVEFTVNITHANRGDLNFVLTSPSGFKSIVPGRTPDNNPNFNNFTFTSIRDYGENSAGTWTVQVYDSVGNGQAGTLNSASLQVFGTPITQ